LYDVFSTRKDGGHVDLVDVSKRLSSAIRGARQAVPRRRTRRTSCATSSRHRSSSCGRSS